MKSLLAATLLSVLGLLGICSPGRAAQSPNANFATRPNIILILADDLGFSDLGSYGYKGNRIQPMEGRSLVPLLDGGNRPEATYVWEHEGNRALRQGDWKLVSRLPGAWELYNMKADRLETHDLEMPEKLTTLAALYDSEARRTGIKPWVGAQTPIGWDDNSKFKK